MRRWIVLALTAVLVVAASAWVSYRVLSDEDDVQELTVGSTTVEVTRRDGATEVRASETDAAELPDFATALGDPVRLEPVDGGTGGTYEVAFRVDPADLPADVDPADGFVTIWTRDEGSDTWEWAGGRWDPDRRTISVATNHLSDWAYAVTDPAALARQARYRPGQGGGFSLGRAVYGNTAALRCPADDIPITYAVARPHDVDVEVCLTQDAATRRYHLEIANAAHVPFELRLPPGLREVDDDAGFPGLGATQDLTAHLLEVSGSGRVLLPADAKVVFEAEGGSLPRDVVIEASMSWAFWANDMGSTFFDVLTFQKARALEEFPALVDNAALGDAETAKGVLDCLDKAGAEIPDLTSASPEKRRERAIEIGGQVMNACYGTLVAGTSAGADRGWFDSLGAQVKSVGRWGKKILDVPAFLTNVGKVSRGWVSAVLMGTFSLVAREDFTDADIKLRPVVAWRTARDLLPPVPTGQPDDRDLIAVERAFGLPGNGWFSGGTSRASTCTPDVMELADYARYGTLPGARRGYDVGDAIGVYSSSVDVRARGVTARVSFSVQRIARGREKAAVEQLAAAPASCSGMFFLGDAAPTDYREIPDELPGDVESRTWSVIDRSSAPGPRAGFDSWTISEGWLLNARMSYTGEAGAAAEVFARQRFTASVVLDDRLGTEFSGG